MICRSCIRKVTSLRPSNRPFSSSLLFQNASAPTAAPTTPSSTPPGIEQQFSTPLSNNPAQGAAALSKKSSSKNANIPVSICAAGTVMKGLNYMKGKDDPVALAENEYPEWLWRCLDAKVNDEDDGGADGDEFSKSKKLRRKAAKAQRKLEARIIASGDVSSLQPKIPLTKQSIDLPANEEGTLAGALEAGDKREELRGAMRRERRAKIKEGNYLKGM